MEVEGPERGAPAPLGGLAWLRDVTGLGPFRPVDDLELDLLAFFECPESGPLNRGEVHENVVSPLAFNKSVALRVIKPLHLTSDTHTTCLPYKTRDGDRRGDPPPKNAASSTGHKKKTAARGLDFDAGPPNVNARLYARFSRVVNDPTPRR